MFRLGRSGTCERWHTEFDVSPVPISELLASLSGTLAFKTKARSQLHCQNAAILYVLDASFSNSWADFFSHFQSRNWPFFITAPQPIFTILIPVIFFGQLRIDIASLVLSKAWCKLGSSTSEFLPPSKSDFVSFISCGQGCFVLDRGGIWLSFYFLKCLTNAYLAFFKYSSRRFDSMGAWLWVGRGSI